MTPPFSPTWTLGPNRAYTNLLDWPNPWTLQVQLQDLHPGEFWIPALEANILTKRTLLPQANPGTWRFRNTDFAWLMRHRYTPLRLAGSFRASKVDITCFHRPTASVVFQFFFKPAIVQKIASIVTDAAGNYSFGGTAQMAWIGVP